MMARKKERDSPGEARKEGGIACWCGSTAMAPFNDDYGVCRDCGTLVLLREDPPGRKPVVVDDDRDFYGKQYWLQHQEGELGNPDIHKRARTDLAERNLHWLAAALDFRLPPGRTLELGCGNGSFVALMKLAGFEASGAEMSPWVVEFGRRTFGAEIRVGPVESLDVAPGTLDAVLMMDVLEHIPDPAATLRRCVALLKGDGLLFIQTPRYREGTTYTRMVEGNDPFLEQLKPEEHLYLFTEQSVRRLMQEVGAPHVEFGPAIFAHYDMFLVAGRAPLDRKGEAAIEQALLATPGGRIAIALLDLRKRAAALTAELAQARSDVEFLKGTFEGAESDRAARGRVIEEQGQSIMNLQAKVHEHLTDLAALTQKHSVLLADQAQTEARLNELRRDYSTVVEDRAARSKVIDEHARTISTLQVQIDTFRGQLAELRRQFDLVEADRIARGEVIERQGRREVQLEALVHETLQSRDAHQAEGVRLGAEVAALQGRLEQSEGRHRGNEARWWFRLGRRLGLL